MRRASLVACVALSAPGCVRPLVPVEAPTPCAHCGSGRGPDAPPRDLAQHLIELELWHFESASGAKYPASGATPSVASAASATRILGADLTGAQLEELEDVWGQPFTLAVVDAHAWSTLRGAFSWELEAAWGRARVAAPTLADTIGARSLAALGPTYAEYVDSFAPGAILGPTDTWPAVLVARDVEVSTLAPRIRGALARNVTTHAASREAVHERFLANYPQLLFAKTTMAGKIPLPQLGAHVAAVLAVRVQFEVDVTVPVDLVTSLVAREEPRLVLGTRPRRAKPGL